jgi:putative acetyltransferase
MKKKIWMQTWQYGFLPTSRLTALLHPAVKAALPKADVFVFEQQGRILGFAGMNGEFIEGLFVLPGQQSNGIGKQMINHLKTLRSRLSLHVYQKNRRAVQFYLREGFSVTKSQLDCGTGQTELVMDWNLACIF